LPRKGLADFRRAVLVMFIKARRRFMECEVCGHPVKEEEGLRHKGVFLCEDCFIEAYPQRCGWDYLKKIKPKSPYVKESVEE
jgi:hypothetical protein